MSKFILLVREKDEMEIILNVDHISKIEVRYVAPTNDPENDNKKHTALSLKDASKTPAAVRAYKVFIGSESFKIPGVVDDPVVRVIQEIYAKAIRNPEAHARPSSDDGDGK